MPSGVNKKNQTSKPNEETNPLNRLMEIYERHLLLIWLSIILIPILILTIGTLLLPEIFYEQFIWPYFWGTIEADAKDQTYGDVTEAYNPVNTLFYAFIVIIVLYWTYKLFKKYEINIDLKFFIAIIPFILIGGIARTLEDAELFYSPVVYLFIAPIIYIFIGIVVLSLMMIGHAIKRYANQTSLRSGLLLTASVFVALDIIYIFTYFGLSEQFAYMLNPLIPVIISIFIILGVIEYTKKTNRIEISTILLSTGLWFLLINLLVLGQWQRVPEWSDAYFEVNPGNEVIFQPWAFILVLGLTCLCVILVYIFSKFISIKKPEFKPFLSGINLTLFFGHFLDASATFIAIDHYGYVEKHVLPTFFIDLFNTGAVMLVLKAVIIILVIYFLDVLYKKDFQDNPTLLGLVKIAILVLGLAPGIRDILRLSIGV